MYTTSRAAQFMKMEREREKSYVVYKSLGREEKQ